MMTDLKLISLELSSRTYLEYLNKYPKLIKNLLSLIIMEFINSDLTDSEVFDSGYEELKWNTYLAYKESDNLSPMAELLPDIFDDLYTALKYDLYPRCIIGKGAKIIKYFSIQHECIRFLVESKIK